MFSFLYWHIALTTLGVATLGLDPPIILGRMEPVSLNLKCRERDAHLLIELTLGMFSCVQMLSDNNRSLISQANMVGFSCLYLMIASTTEGVATLGLDPPITPGLVEPVSKYL